MKTFKLRNTAQHLGLGAAGLVLAGLVLSACTTESTPPKIMNRAALIDTGTVIFSENCVGCHGNDGEGGRGPNVANSDYVMHNPERLIHTLLRGVTDSIRVNGAFWAGGGMPNWDYMSDVQIAGLLTYIRGVLNDTLVTNCVVNPTDENDITCTRTARTTTEIASDSITPAQVKAVRDTLSPL